MVGASRPTLAGRYLFHFNLTGNRRVWATPDSKTASPVIWISDAVTRSPAAEPFSQCACEILRGMVTASPGFSVANRSSTYELIRVRRYASSELSATATRVTRCVPAGRRTPPLHREYRGTWKMQP